MSRFAMITEDPDYDLDDEGNFFYDLDDEGQWVEIPCDADGNPIQPDSYSPFDTVNS